MRFFTLLFACMLVYQVTAGQKLCRAKDKRSLEKRANSFTEQDYARAVQYLKLLMEEYDSRHAETTTGTASVHPEWTANTQQKTVIYEDTLVPCEADIEEEDIFDFEEDPDDVDEPPVKDGVVVDREE
ncbi:uncharacterized protein B0P05DRAFT_528935 [Gilbertella persicaria]|uniref:uncharacterized protein n=1 Tax=Gilbertella persicaria TaxID=101096 RepID=UPI002220A4D6|nr:uncharacterized protein B0P05DRAFT_528935 [Gilbertella persicaria]KAI8091134.1 hypothetical protein B0P05DRAFT_528935 [Gilbertella persicaria]